MIKELIKSKDSNGNTTCKVICEKGTFSIQTNQNLPTIHRLFAYEGWSECFEFSEVNRWVKKHGTERQKELTSQNQLAY